MKLKQKDINRLEKSIKRIENSIINFKLTIAKLEETKDILWKIIRERDDYIFGVLPKRVEKLEKRIKKLEKKK